MLKRFLWFVLPVLGGGIVWLWLWRRRNDIASIPAQFASSQAAPQTSLFAPMSPASPIMKDMVVLDESGIATGMGVAADTNTIDATGKNERPPETADREIPISAEGPGGVITAPPDTHIDITSDASTTSEYAPSEFTPLDQAAGAVADTTTDELHGISAYCFRCKTKRVIDGAHEEITESGRRGARGTCPVCGTSLFTFLPDDSRSEG